MKDFNGNELAVGDTVAYAQAGYTTLYKGYVVKITAKGVKVAQDLRAMGVFRYGSDVIKV